MFLAISALYLFPLKTTQKHIADYKMPIFYKRTI